MALVRYQSPFNVMSDMRQEINRLFDAGLNSNGNEEQSFATWRPHVDIQENAESYVVHADLPGVEAKDIKISLEKNILTIQGERIVESKKENAEYQRVERFSGSFCRQFNLPNNVDSDNISAKSKKGVLELVIPKQETSASKYIDVQSED